MKAKPAGTGTGRGNSVDFSFGLLVERGYLINYIFYKIGGEGGDRECDCDLNEQINFGKKTKEIA